MNDLAVIVDVSSNVSCPRSIVLSLTDDTDVCHLLYKPEFLACHFVCRFLPFMTEVFVFSM